MERAPGVRSGPRAVLSSGPRYLASWAAVLAAQGRGRAGLAGMARAPRPTQPSLPSLPVSCVRQFPVVSEQVAQIDELAKLDPACHFTCQPHLTHRPFSHPHPTRDHDNRLLTAIKGEAISGSRALQLCSFSFVGWLSFNTLIPPLSFCPYWQQAGHETNNRHSATHTLLTSSPLSLPALPAICRALQYRPPIQLLLIAALSPSPT